jgi:hypothetical protein
MGELVEKLRSAVGKKGNAANPNTLAFHVRREEEMEELEKDVAKNLVEIQTVEKRLQEGGGKGDKVELELEVKLDKLKKKREDLKLALSACADKKGKKQTKEEVQVS